jgi:hypothetical protein
MSRPALIDTLPSHQRLLAANMMYRNESFDTIFKYIDINDSMTTRSDIKQLVNELDVPMSDALYAAHMNLAELDYIIAVAAEKSEDGSVHHMTRYKQLAELRIKAINQIDELAAKEVERGHSWEPVFDVNSPEYRVFKAAIKVALSKKKQEKSDFNILNDQEKARFYQILAESGS